MAHAERTLRVIVRTAMGVSTALTGAAFWLSYQNLQHLASSHGEVTPVNAWLWPGTVDAFIVIGELLCLRAAINKAVDWWAVGLLAFGGIASIALNVSEVGAGGHPLDYVVSAMPPVAALLAFGAITQAVHRAVLNAEQATDQGEHTPDQPVYLPEQPTDQPETITEQTPEQDDQTPDHGMRSLPNDLITREEVMSILRVSSPTITRYSSAGTLKCVHVDASRRKYYSRAEVLKLKNPA